VQKEGDEALGRVVGVLVQSLPDGDLEALKRIGADLESRLHDAVAKADPLDATAVLAALFPGAPVMVENPVRFICTCSHERAMTTLEGLGATEVQAIVDTMGSTAVTCQFCGTKHEITLQNLWEILERLGKPQTKH
jgi:molecular chaperone Hsp33